VPLPPGCRGRTIVDITCGDGFFQRQPDGEENAEIVVRLDDVVAWHNAGREAHDIAGGPWRSSGRLGPDQSFVWIATQTGSFPYQCTRTPGMSAVLRVEPSNA
jgi:plastocyanin